MVKNRRASRQTTGIIVVSLLLLALLTINVTFAYFTSQVSTTTGQSLAFDTLVLSVTDESDWDVKTGSRETKNSIVPGSELDMSGIVTLTGASAYLKVSFNVVGTAAEGGSLDSVATDAIKGALGDALNAQPASLGRWVQDGVDKAWYCVVPNAAGDVIDFSLGTVTIPLTTTGNVWQGASVAISFTVSAIQSDHVTVTGNSDNDKAQSLKTLFDSINLETGLID